jgi:hypothetical protein
MSGMDMSAEERAMWEAIDRAIPRLRTLIGELRTSGEDFRANGIGEIADDLSGSRPTVVDGRIQRAAKTY